jgi:hypothetical protein
MRLSIIWRWLDQILTGKQTILSGVACTGGASLALALAAVLKAGRPEGTMHKAKATC